MRVKEIEVSAAKNQPLPDYPTIVEMCLHTALRALYQQYRNGSLEKEQAKTEKNKIISKYNLYESERINMLEVYKYHQENIRKASTLLSDIEKSENINDIAVKACEVIGCMTGDKGFLKRQEVKIKLGGIT